MYDYLIKVDKEEGHNQKVYKRKFHKSLITLWDFLHKLGTRTLQ